MQKIGWDSAAIMRRWSRLNSQRNFLQNQKFVVWKCVTGFPVEETYFEKLIRLMQKVARDVNFSWKCQVYTGEKKRAKRQPIKTE